MAKRKFIVIDCAEAAKTCDKKQYSEATTSEKVRMLIHFAFCKRCRHYSLLNRKLTNLMNRSEIKTCSQEEKSRIKQQLQKEIRK